MPTNEAELKQYLAQFRHKIHGKVKFEDVDSFGVVHNIKYLYWVEWARTEYMHDMFAPGTKGNFLQAFPVMVVRNEADYLDAMYFNDEYTVLSRVDKVGKSSITFENLVMLDDVKPVLHMSSVFVHVDNNYKQSCEIPDDIRRKIADYPGNF